MKLRDFYANQGLAATLNKYVDADDLSERFAKTEADLSANECLIPILGTQGAGKSSFLNAVLFGDIVLPVDADETTCIPTAVRYGENASPEAFVVLSSGERRPVECSERGLSDYVHQEKNPGNQKGVAYIDIVLKNDLLKAGIVFVDLPGVGSITEANQKTTLEYLRKCSAAIFMLRTVPPITQSESIFIQGALPLMGRVFWVQNQWTDESRSEVIEGRDWNYDVLKKIAKRLGQPESLISQPDVVCVKHALDARILNDTKRVDESGILSFRDSVVAFAQNWRREVFEGKKSQAISLLKSAIETADKKIAQLSGDAEKEREKIRDEKRKQDEALEHDTKLVRQARDFLSERRDALSTFVTGECRRFAENLRNNVRESIDGGLVGGELLNRAFRDHVKRGNEELFQAIQPTFLDVGTQLSQILSGLEAAGSKLSGVSLSASGDGFSEKSKAHAYYNAAGSLAGGIAGSVATAALLGTTVFAPFAMIGAAIGGLLGLFFGSCAREVQIEAQQEAAREELFRSVQTLEKKLHKEYTERLESFTSEVEENIRAWLKRQKANVDMRYQQALVDLEKPLAEKEQLVDEVERDKALFTRLVGEME